MYSYPDSSEVFGRLGDKVIDGLARSIALARMDLSEYRSQHPDWAADHTERGLATWIHDRIWRHLAAQLDGIPRVNFYDDGVTREMTTEFYYRLRVKRHSLDGRVSSYPTQAALDFMDQEPLQLALEGLAEVRLIAGYEWDSMSRAMGRGVLSLRDGYDNIVWLEGLPDVDSGKFGVPLTPWPAEPGPIGPSIETKSESDEQHKGEESGSE